MCEVNLFSKYHTKMKIKVPNGIETHHSVKNALNNFYSLPDTYQKPHSLSVLTRFCSATSDSVSKNGTYAFSVK